MTSNKLDYSVLDTGPCLNFLGTGHGEILLEALESISAQLIVPEDVAEEVESKSAEISTYAGAAKRLYGAEAGNRITIARARLGDQPELDIWVAKLTGVPNGYAPSRAKDLGEQMVVAHARMLQDRGHRVIVVINDREGRELAAKHQVRCTTTLDILRKAALLGIIPDRPTMRSIYMRMQPHDYVLPNIRSKEVQEKLFTKDLNYGEQSDRRATRLSTD